MVVMFHFTLKHLNPQIYSFCLPSGILIFFFCSSPDPKLKCSVTDYLFLLSQGLLSDGSVEYTDSYKHMSAIVVLNSVESLVDLMRFPGKLIPFSAKAIFMFHFSAAGESDLADYDSCDSPLEPNSPLCGLYDRTDGAWYMNCIIGFL